MVLRNPDNPPRWWVTASSIGAFMVGAYVMIEEVNRATGAERPTLLGFAYLLMAGAPIAWAADRFRR